jgi:hypothetical protein
MVYFQTKIPILECLKVEDVVYFMATWSILLTFGIFCGFYGHLVIFSRFGMLYQENSGSPALHSDRERYGIVQSFQLVHMYVGTHLKTLHSKFAFHKTAILKCFIRKIKSDGKRFESGRGRGHGSNVLR